MMTSAAILHGKETVSDLKQTVESLHGCLLIDIISYDLGLPFLMEEYLSKTFHITVLNAEFDYKSELNKLINADGADFIVILKGGDILDNIVPRIDYYYSLGKKFAMIKPTFGLSGLIVNVPTFQWLCGWGEQTIIEKIEIQALNEEKPDMVLSLDDFYERTKDYNAGIGEPATIA